MKLDIKKFESIKHDSKSPSTKKHHVGVEIECYGPFRKDILVYEFLKAGLDKQVSVGNDGSIDPPDNYRLEEGYHTYEIRIIDAQSNIETTIKKVCDILSMLGCRVNSSCGLHVHLDMRNRDHKKAYQKLVDSYPTLSKMVAKHRLNNDYCYKNSTNKFEGEEIVDSWDGRKYKRMDDRQSAINPHAYAEHKTLEVRMHHGCLKEDKINNWIKTLIKIIS